MSSYSFSDESAFSCDFLQSWSEKEKRTIWKKQHQNHWFCSSTWNVKSLNSRTMALSVWNQVSKCGDSFSLYCVSGTIVQNVLIWFLSAWNCWRSICNVWFACSMSNFRNGLFRFSEIQKLTRIQIRLKCIKFTTFFILHFVWSIFYLTAFGIRNTKCSIRDQPSKSSCCIVAPFRNPIVRLEAFDGHIVTVIFILKIKLCFSLLLLHNLIENNYQILAANIVELL